jgi:hypothetical protein
MKTNATHKLERLLSKGCGGCPGCHGTRRERATTARWLAKVIEGRVCAGCGAIVRPDRKPRRPRRA